MAIRQTCSPSAFGRVGCSLQTAQAECRAIMHKVIHASGSAWHHCAQPLCDFVASVATDMHSLAVSLLPTAPDQPQAATMSPAATPPAQKELLPRARFLTLAAISATIVAVMLHHPCPNVALSAHVIQRQLGSLLMFADDVAHRPLANADAVDAALRACMQFSAAWLALMHRVTPLHIVAAALEHPCCCLALAGALPEGLPAHWLRPYEAAGATARAVPASLDTAAVARPVDTSVDAGVVCMVEQAFANVLADLGANAAPVDAAAELALAAAELPVMAGAAPPHVAAGASPQLPPTSRREGQKEKGGLALQDSLPLWLALMALISAALGTNFLLPPGTPPECSAALLSLLPASSVRLRNSAWAALSVFAPALGPISAFCSRTPHVPSSPAPEPWAAALWCALLAHTPSVLAVPSASDSDTSRSVATYLVSLVSHEGGEPAIVHVCTFLRTTAAKLALLTAAPPLEPAPAAAARHGEVASSAPSQPGSAAPSAQVQHVRFQALFAIHLLQTASRRQGLTSECQLTLARHLSSLLAASPSQPAPTDLAETVTSMPLVQPGGPLVPASTDNEPRGTLEAPSSASVAGRATETPTPAAVAAFDENAVALTSTAGQMAGWLQGLSMHDHVQLLSITTLAIQRAASAPLPKPPELGRAAVATFSHSCHLLLRALSLVVSSPLPHSTLRLPDDRSPDAVHEAAECTAVCTTLQQLAPLLPSSPSCTASVLMHCIDLLILTAAAAAASTDAAITVTLNPTLAGPLPGVAAATAAPEPTASPAPLPPNAPAHLLIAAAQLLHVLSTPPFLRCRRAAARIAALCGTGMSLPGTTGGAFAAIIQSVAAWATSPSTPPVRCFTESTHKQADQALQDIEAAVKASVEVLQTAAVKGRRPTRVQPHVAHVLMRELLQLIGGGSGESSAKVLLAAGAHCSLSPAVAC
jgi:hypothetical protein